MHVTQSGFIILEIQLLAKSKVLSAELNGPSFYVTPVVFIILDRMFILMNKTALSHRGNWPLEQYQKVVTSVDQKRTLLAYFFRANNRGWILKWVYLSTDKSRFLIKSYLNRDIRKISLIALDLPLSLQLDDTPVSQYPQLIFALGFDFRLTHRQLQ